MLEEIHKLGKKEGIERKEKDYLTIKKDISNSLKALIARGIWGMESYYEITNQSDAIFLKGVEVLRQNKIKDILKNN